MCRRIVTHSSKQALVRVQAVLSTTPNNPKAGAPTCRSEAWLRRPPRRLPRGPATSLSHSCLSTLGALRDAR